jgi:hypothetical protein
MRVSLPGGSSSKSESIVSAWDDSSSGIEIRRARLRTRRAERDATVHTRRQAPLRQLGHGVVELPDLSPTCRPDDPIPGSFTRLRPCSNDPNENRQACVNVVQIGAVLGVLVFYPGGFNPRRSPKYYEYLV